MSTPGSVRSGEAASYTPPVAAPTSQPPRPRRVRVVRWQGIIPLTLVLALLYFGWALFGGRILRATLMDAGSDALGTQLDIQSVEVGLLATRIEIATAGGAMQGSPVTHASDVPVAVLREEELHSLALLAHVRKEQCEPHGITLAHRAPVPTRPDPQ